MEQKSNVQNRAEKEYKNSREKFYLLLREIVSNSIQAVLIRKDKLKNKSVYHPELTLDISFSEEEKKCNIRLKDNGEGFTKNNADCFNELDKKNSEKERYNYHPLGQGRLAIVYFSDKAVFETAYRIDDGSLKRREFPYPNPNDGLYSLFDFDELTANVEDSYTLLKIAIEKQNTLSRAKTFFKKYSTINALKQWFAETFFPAIVSNEDLVIKLIYNGDVEKITRESIEAETKSEPFKVSFVDEGEYDFKLWFIKRDSNKSHYHPIQCFARGLKAELENEKLGYSIDSEDGYLFYLTSKYFDEHVDNKGETIEISLENIELIKEKINELLDDKFKETIEQNRRETLNNLKDFRKKYPSLEAFVSDQGLGEGKSIMDETDLVKAAIDAKGGLEKNFWTKPDLIKGEDGETPYDESEECQKLLNSSLHIYVKHRERVLKRLFEMIQPCNEEGEIKDELEEDVQELLFRRGTLVDNSKNINHLHNLWILDDKFTTFSTTLKGKSTKKGQGQSDIYIWADNPQSVKQVLILELKSTTHAHNAGSKDESMIAQVKRYASDVYNRPRTILNWDVDTDSIQYQGVILARKADILKEISSNNAGGGFRKIPFLSDSRYKEDEFYPIPSSDKAISIRIELYSFEDIYSLASSRNEVFFRLLKNELGVDEQS